MVSGFENNEINIYVSIIKQEDIESTSSTMSVDSQNNGLCTSTWGSPGWFFLHSVTAGYPVDPDEFDSRNGNPVGQTRREYKTFFTTAGSVLPCKFCRDSYKAFIRDLPIDRYIHSRASLFEWLFKIHNKVNEKLGVRQETDLESVVDKYESFRAQCPKSKVSTGCTVPAGDYKKMKCRVVIEPFDKCNAVSIVVSTTLLTLGVILFVLRTRKS